MEKKLTILAFGAGQDSTAILYKIVLDKTFRQRYVSGKLLVLMSDTGNEHPHTYDHVQFIREFCTLHNIEFCFIKPDMGYHPKSWPTLQYQFQKNSSIMSVAFNKVCTDNLKIKPLYNCLDHYIAIHYYDYKQKQPPKGKRFVKRFHKEHGQINVILGIAAGEETRIEKSNNKSNKNQPTDPFQKNQIPKKTWMDICISRIYPLVELDMNRKACQEYILAIGLPLPFPSNCMMCPFASKIEILWLYRNYPAVFYEWVSYEKAKLEKFAGSSKANLGVKGKFTLEVVLQQAIAEFGHMSDCELDEHKMSHGHCVKSAY